MSDSPSAPKPRISWCEIRGYKSIRNPIRLEFPDNQPLILIGENNAGKSNIVSAIEFVLGEWWPAFRDREDYYF